MALLVLDASFSEYFHPLRRLLRSHHVDDPLRDQALNVGTAHNEELEHRYAIFILLPQHVAAYVRLRADRVLALRAVGVLRGTQHDRYAPVVLQADAPELQEVARSDAGHLQHGVEHVRAVRPVAEEVHVREDLVPFDALPEVIEKIKGDVHVHPVHGRPGTEGDDAVRVLHLGHPDLLPVDAHVPADGGLLLLLEEQIELAERDGHLVFERDVELHEVVPTPEKGLLEDLRGLPGRERAGVAGLGHRRDQQALLRGLELVVLQPIVVGVVAVAARCLQVVLHVAGRVGAGRLGTPSARLLGVDSRPNLSRTPRRPLRIAAASHTRHSRKVRQPPREQAGVVRVDHALHDPGLAMRWELLGVRHHGLDRTMLQEALHSVHELRLLFLEHSGRVPVHRGQCLENQHRPDELASIQILPMLQQVVHVGPQLALD
mmetsp:Transcript_85843/g.262666  ORF Transcript_85843/g.262666 Transcript_85843/m.262666 type:complete len:432 (+) Transcript_85843:325-1620(+)